MNSRLPNEVVVISESLARQRDARWASTLHLDETFASRGFCSVTAEAKIYQRVFGMESYEALAFLPESREKALALENAAARRDWLLTAERAKLPNKVERFWSIVHEPNLDCFAKLDIGRRFFPDLLYLELSPYFEEFDVARRAEFSNVCRLNPSPTINLMDRRTAKRRKEIYCEVMDDAFGALGFKAAGKNQGVKRYSKQIGSALSVHLVAEAAMFSIDFSGVLGPDNLVATNLFYRCQATPSFTH